MIFPDSEGIIINGRCLIVHTRIDDRDGVRSLRDLRRGQQKIVSGGAMNNIIIV